MYGMCNGSPKSFTPTRIFKPRLTLQHSSLRYLNKMILTGQRFLIHSAL